MNDSTVLQLRCSETDEIFPANQVAHLSSCGRPLLVEYDLEKAATLLTRDDVCPSRNMWQFRPVLPLPPGEEPVSLGEGGTPMVRADRLASSVGHEGTLWIKDEGLNPTGSFKARGLSAAVTMARHLGCRRLVIPTAGNAGGALAAYCARAGMEALVIMPRDTPTANKIETRMCGARIIEVDGLISDCGAMAGELCEREDWYDISTLKEPYRLEGKKTMGYELAAFFGWRLPDAIIYPAGGGTGLIGMWKAFDEMERMGWLGAQRPKMFAVQSVGCAPIVRAFEEGKEEATPWIGAETIAAGLRVPSAVGDRLMLRVIRDSSGGAVAVEEEDLVRAAWSIADKTGILPAPEGAATLSALSRLLQDEQIHPHDEVVLFNTGTGLKYLETLEEHGSDRN